MKFWQVRLDTNLWGARKISPYVKHSWPADATRFRNQHLLLIGRDLSDEHHVHLRSALDILTLHSSETSSRIGYCWRTLVVVTNTITSMSDKKTTFSTLCSNNFIVKKNLPKQIQCDAIFKHPKRNDHFRTFSRDLMTITSQDSPWKIKNV